MVLGKVAMSFTYKNRLLMGGAVAFLLMIPAIASDEPGGLKAFRAGDYETAFKIWKPLADKGDANAQCDLGIMFQKGLGVDRDPAQAFQLFQAAANQGNAQ